MNKLRPLQVYFLSSEWIHAQDGSLLFTYYTCAREKVENSPWECIRGGYEVSDAQSSPAYHSIQHTLVPVFRFDPFPKQTIAAKLGSPPKMITCTAGDPV